MKAMMDGKQVGVIEVLEGDIEIQTIWASNTKLQTNPDGSRIQTNGDGTIIETGTDGVEVTLQPNGGFCPFPSCHFYQPPQPASYAARAVQPIYLMCCRCLDP